MIKTVTQSDFIRYAYNECGLHDSDRIQRAIDGDPLASGEFDEMVSIIQLPDKACLEPSQRSIDRILDFAKSCKS